MPFVSKRKNKSLTRFRANLRGAFQRSATKSIILRCSDGSRALFAGNESLPTFTLPRTLARVPHIFTFHPRRKRHGRHGGNLAQARVQPLPVRPRLHRAVHTVRHPTLLSSPPPVMPEPRDFAASKAAAARVSPRAARRIDGARRGKRFVFGFRAGSLRLRPRPFPSRRVTHGAVHRPPWHAFVARDALSENIKTSPKTRLFAIGLTRSSKD